MYGAAFEFDRAALDGIDAHANASPKLMQTALKRQESRLRSRGLKRLRKKPGAVKYPVQWTSERQRRAFFATDGFGGGIPSKRTDTMVNSWEAKFSFSEDGGAFAFTNDDPKTPFVVGRRQQKMHIATGWYNADREIDAFAPEVLDAYTSTWLTVADPFAGVPR